ncbi:MAG: 3-oxoacyl-[acyl-carrier-protein] reductase [Cyanobacteria bacterium HKST-UBA06]|nr:3-oxoacyl-[acyl-carrier-protein] reductase [Cyanobacteria bacterium HKST-UBA05]MCA9799184.1 3-oxoacyl-[acyl-carrier-protein] reductase [Cyanobacteria bacterium HKST-UBA04]MCA9807458.1 3-oxoacyl-[acyl-carrier-protein] reductase [Cyanobacteria bacterium HKST-UBA06]MCA9840802.1 3-oxoacyl-[acyl-carrier-protein] reductase [Cyanobacteria bacterium HKST-UBA03]
MNATEQEQKVAVVTGGSRGIGKACVEALAKEGYDIVLTYAANQEAADQTVEIVKRLGRQAKAIKADAADPDAAQQVIDDAVATFGRIDALVNNAGITRDGLLIRQKQDDWRQVLDTNLSGAYYLTQAAAKVMMKQRQGSIINMSSISGVYGNAGQTNYAASKAGLIGLTKACAKELASRNITVNAVAPGFIATDMTDGLNAEAIKERIPLGRLGNPDDIANTVVFLIKSGSYITGQVFQVDGGLVI